MAGYLFAHFIGDTGNGEQIYFSLSEDGLHWNDLADGQPVLCSDIGEKGARDPFLVRDPNRQHYYLIATDLRIASGEGWTKAVQNASRNLLIWESEDLCHWTQPRLVELAVEEAGCAWAPEVIYDEEKQEFLVFWASWLKTERAPQGKHHMFAAYTRDFKEFSETFLYAEKDQDIIDTTIVRENNWYYRFIKDEASKCIIMERSQSLLGEFEQIYSETLANLYGVEGPECYQLPDGRWCLIVDQFAKQAGYLPLVTDDLNSGSFRILDAAEYDLGKNCKRHGGILRLTDEEYRCLKEYKY